MKPWIKLKTVKDRLGYSDEDQDPDLYRCLIEAQQVVCDYIEQPSDFYDTGLPLHIETAILFVIDNIKHRPQTDPISEAVKSLLMRTRVPIAL